MGFITDLLGKAARGMLDTGREMQICVSIAEGFSNEEIQELLGNNGQMILRFRQEGAGEVNSTFMNMALRKVATDRNLM